MIDIKPKIHDSNTLEFKVGFTPEPGVTYNDFHMNTWIFIPEVLDVNRHTYGKESFYRDTLSYLRLITPSHSLSELAGEESLPMSRIMQACRGTNGEDTDFEDEVKMFASIVKSSVREAFNDIAGESDNGERIAKASRMLANLAAVLKKFRALREEVPQSLPRGKDNLVFFDFADEFMSNLAEQHTGRLVKLLAPIEPESAIFNDIERFTAAERQYRTRRGFLNVSRHGGAQANRQFVYRASQLKKYIESNLYLPTHKRRNTVFLEQVAFSLAAGVSMVFATIVSFAFQQTYGNFTLPFFIALVISYMFKDRIKDLIRNYFSHGLGSRFYDYLITIRINNRKIGWVKEGFDFVSPSDVSRHVNEKRARKNPLVVNRGVDEQVIQYRKYVHLKRKSLNRLAPYSMSGINNIVRFNLSCFMRKMDNPRVPLFVSDSLDSGGDNFTEGDKAYYINFVIQCTYEKSSYYKRYRVCLCRDGIKAIEEKK